MTRKTWSVAACNAVWRRVVYLQPGDNSFARKTGSIPPFDLHGQGIRWYATRFSLSSCASPCSGWECTLGDGNEATPRWMTTLSVVERRNRRTSFPTTGKRIVTSESGDLRGHDVTYGLCHYCAPFLLVSLSRIHAAKKPLIFKLLAVCFCKAGNIYTALLRIPLFSLDCYDRPMARTPSPFCYRRRNWSEYHRALINRGRLAVWFDDHAIAGWRADRHRVLQQIGTHGRSGWRILSGYTRQSSAENTRFRFQRLFARHLWARSLGTQRAETLVKWSVLNRRTQVGMPETARVG
jgi:hypothetical protein